MDLNHRVQRLEASARRWRGLAIVAGVGLLLGAAGTVKPFVVNSPLQVVDETGKPKIELHQNGDLAFGLGSKNPADSVLHHGAKFRTVTGGGRFTAGQEVVVFEGNLRGGELLVVYQNGQNSSIVLTDTLLVSGRNEAVSPSSVTHIGGAYFNSGDAELRFLEDKHGFRYGIRAIPVPGNPTKSKVQVTAKVLNVSGTFLTEARGVFEEDGL